MGNTHAGLLPFSPDEQSRMQDETKLSQDEMMNLFRKFRKMDLHKSGEITFEEFRRIPELASNPLVGRLFAVMDTDGNGIIDFDEFLNGISVFTPARSDEDRLRFLFSIYDVDRDGLISNGELFSVLKIMTGASLPDRSLQQLVDRTIRDYNRSGAPDGITFDDFRTMLTEKGAAFEQTLKVEL
ncbi:putative calcineurin subunit B [Paratrimastix pyriformis]|uniref:Calcineurin subunit B n=1 Tax=Paratrimastix pyriformis TaxID=342808 RepID=A0ABQ8U099_9EUKA|nr:putative calcineurin subunit B [Paratrimastix pyriformis]